MGVRTRARSLAGDLVGAGLDQVVARHLPETPLGPGDLRATWFGAASVLLDDGRTRLLLDPFVTRPGMLRVGLGFPLRPDGVGVERWLDRLGARGTAAVLVSHSHYDHLLDAAVFARKADAILVGSESTANVGRGAGLPDDRIRVAQPWTPMQFGAFEVTFLPSEHAPALLGRVPYPGAIPIPLRTPAPARAFRMGAVHGIRVRHPAGSLVHLASAQVGSGTFRDTSAHTVLLALAGRASTERLLEAVVDALGARRVIPIHWDDLFRSLARSLRPLPSVGLAGFFEDVSRLRPDLEVATLPMGQPRTLFGGG
ncbi:MAG: MBL fold metallo-hydrolase [Deltaproteobacteria bacterium]|nr:MBL fold metallo-hydrolase [Deltaproteobacteria bacterium]